MASIEHRVTKQGERWRVVWREDGDKQQQTYSDAQRAEAFRKRVEAYGNHWPPGEDPRPAAAPPKLTFAEWAETAIGQRERANERTKADYRRDFTRHLAPLLGHVPVDDLDEKHVTDWLADRRKVLSEKTVRNLHGFASSLMADALTHYPPLCRRNPFAQRIGRGSAVRVEEMVFLTPQEFAAVLKWVREEYRPLIRFLAGTGLRFGEATALTVADVDLLGKRKTVTVTKAWKRTGSREYVVGEPKTSRSRRTLSLSPELVELLIPLVSSRRGGELLFCGRHGLRLPHSEVYKRGWAPALARARVCDTHYEPQRTKRNPNERPRLPAPCDCDGVLDKKPRIHDLRHSWVSWMIADGLDLPIISRRAGHSSITITFDRYGHLDPAMDARVDAAVDRALGSALV